MTYGDAGGAKRIRRHIPVIPAKAGIQIWSFRDDLMNLRNLPKFLLGQFLLLLILSLHSTTFAQGYRGHDFWICFPQNAIFEDGKTLQQSLYITAESRASGVIENIADSSTKPFSIEAGASTSVDIDTLIEITSSGRLEKKSVHITSDNDITVYVVSHRSASTDSYAAIPTPMLGTEYVVAGYSAHARDGTVFTSQADIIATEDNTLVTVHLTAATRDSLPEGRTISLFMDRGQTLQFQGTYQNERSDLTGTLVTSSKPIAFFTGHSCAQVPANVQYCDMLLEMEPPVKDWGTSFIVPALAGKGYSVIRVIADYDSTEVLVNGARATLLMRSGYYEIDTLHYDAVIQTSKPALVAQYATSSEADNLKVGDPFMLFVIPNDRLIREVTTASVTEGPFRHYLNIVVSDTGLATLTLDDVLTTFGKYPNQISLVSKRKVSSFPKAAGYSILTFQVPSGRHQVRCAAPVAVYSYGFGLYNNAYDSYGHACGERLDR